MNLNPKNPGFGPVETVVLIAISCLWCTVAILAWATTLIVAGGGLGTVNLVVLAMAFWGPVLGFLAGGTQIAASLLLGHWIPRRVADPIAALIGWAIALLLWGILVFADARFEVLVGSVVVAILGAVTTYVLTRRRARSIS